MTDGEQDSTEPQESQRDADQRVPVTVRWTGTHWRVDYVNPCLYCGRKHQHGAGNSVDGPHLEAGGWGSHCGSGHKALGPTCEAVYNLGRLGCQIVHSHTVTAYVAGPLELELAADRKGSK